MRADVTIQIGVPFPHHHGHHYAYYCHDHGRFASAADFYVHIHGAHGIPRHRAHSHIIFRPTIGFIFDL